MFKIDITARTRKCNDEFWVKIWINLTSRMHMFIFFHFSFFLIPYSSLPVSCLCQPKSFISFFSVIVSSPPLYSFKSTCFVHKLLIIQERKIVMLRSVSTHRLRFKPTFLIFLLHKPLLIMFVFVESTATASHSLSFHLPRK